MRILVIEDEMTLLEQIRQRLEAAGHAVDTSSDGKEGLFLASEYPVDLAVVDLGLPGMPGLEIIRALRARGYDLPILILTARAKWEEKVTGLEAGADDYLVKPFHMEELLARVKALLRRATGSGRDELAFGPLRLDTSGQSVSLGTAPLELTAYEYRLLEYLARHYGKVIPKAELADYLYPHDDDRDSNVIEVLIGRLRRKIDPDSRTKPIETLRGRGYRFNLEPA
ncbi:response regulator transcription factor [Thiohalomonas denitrificans]|uniref:response regulator transcription factor n=1 Tax=Thiohalomonas denitrificans TaxID=415747 RepID=UPI0026F2FD37|nr:response regulator transcription factor [Thiohalomonas denitrificans]